MLDACVVPSHATRLLVLSALLLVGGCAHVERPEVFLTNVTPLESTIFEQRVQVDLRVLNPNDADLAVRGLDFRLDVNDVRLARGVSGEAFVVPALGEARTTVIASTTALDLVRNLAGLVQDQELRYTFFGRVRLDQPPFGRTLSFENTGLLVRLPAAGTGADPPSLVPLDPPAQPAEAGLMP